MPHGVAREGGVGSGNDLGLFFEDQFDLLVFVEVDGDVAAVRQPAEQQFVGQRGADRVLNQARHRPRAHQRVEAVRSEMLLQMPW
jgi:hypothetical protein